MLNLLLAILCSALISIIMRLSSRKVSGKLSMLAANYLACSLIAGFHIETANLFPSDPALLQTLGMGMFNGVLYLLAFILFQKCIAKNGVVLPSIFQRLGLLVPLLVSILFFHETPTLLQTIGFLVAVAAMVLINLEKETSAKGAGFGLVILLLAGGAADAMSKVYEEIGASTLSAQFLFFTFFTALLLSIALVILKKEHPGKNELFFGFLIGIPNYFSARFLLRSLTELNAVIVYPTFSVATILVVTLVGIFVFQEQLRKRQWIALIAILAALVMLNV